MTILHTSSLLLLLTAAPVVAHAQDEDLDDLPEETLDVGSAGSVKVRAAPEAEDEDPSFDFGDDPDWDEAPPPVPVPGGLDEDPAEDLPEDDDPADDFFSEDPPDDFSRPAPSADPLDEDPIEGGVEGGIVGGVIGESASRRTVQSAKLGIELNTKGKSPLEDNFAARIVARDLDAVVVEVPVLIASKPSDFTQEYWIITEVLVQDRKVAESRHLVTRASVADMGPTVVWSKSHVPVLERTGDIEVKLSQQTGEGDAQSLFTKTVPYEL
jgi:hypothetical protein